MNKDTSDIIDKIIVAEGGSRETNDPTDRGGRTKYGIAEKANPEAWADGNVTLDEARAIYFKKYVVQPGFDKIEDPTLQHQLVDFGVNSGPFIAVQKLQSVLGVAVDGKLGPKTLEALASKDAKTVNNQLAASRMKLLCQICVKRPSQLGFLNGWADRALSFLK